MLPYQIKEIQESVHSTPTPTKKNGVQKNNDDNNNNDRENKDGLNSPRTNTCSGTVSSIWMQINSFDCHDFNAIGTITIPTVKMRKLSLHDTQ